MISGRSQQESHVDRGGKVFMHPTSVCLAKPSRRLGKGGKMFMWRKRVQMEKFKVISTHNMRGLHEAHTK
jgi:hypothetical protein